MALLLSLETSTQCCSVALHQHGKLLASREIQTPRSAASKLAGMIQEVLDQSNHKATDLNGVIIASGPGSYTGLRIGVATAKGICFALDIPLIAINTLQLLAVQGKDFFLLHHKLATPKKILFCPMLDARRMEVYCKLVDFDLNEIEPTRACVIDEYSFSEYLNQNIIYFLGEGAQKCAEILHHPNAKFLSDVVPQAVRLGAMGYEKWQQSLFEDVASFEPFYLKDFLIKKPKAG